MPMLRERGTRIRKNGMRLARRATFDSSFGAKIRPARPNEEVLTIVNGEVVARSSMKSLKPMASLV